MTNPTTTPRHRADGPAFDANETSLNNALAFIIESLSDDPERSLSFIADIDAETLDEFAADYEFDTAAFNGAIAILRRIRAQLEY